MTFSPIPQTISPLELSEGRSQLHYGIQCIAAIGAALANPLPDQSHTSLAWHPVLEMLMGAPIHATTPFRVVLDPITLTAGLINAQNQIFASQSLHQKTLAEALDWHKDELRKLDVDISRIQWLHYPPDFPDHPLGHGDRFDAHRHIAERWELVHYYANTHQLLTEILSATTAASPIHIWPHHFDMATLIDVPGSPQEEPKTIGIGLSPGDANYPEPYWYVSPYPYPSTTHLPALEGNGFWHTQDWTGAVLTASRLATHAVTPHQSQVRAFLNSAWMASQALLQAM